jgi:hypothetical protein
LAVWCRQRRSSTTGGTACPTPSPPAPEAASAAPGAVDAPARGPQEAAPATARPAADSPARGSAPQGGQS